MNLVCAGGHEITRIILVFAILSRSPQSSDLGVLIVIETFAGFRLSLTISRSVGRIVFEHLKSFQKTCSNCGFAV